MKTAAWIGLVLLSAAATTVQAQEVEAQTYTVMTYAPTGGTGDGTMVFVEGGTFAYDSTTNGTLTGYFLETTGDAGEPVVYAMYFNSAEDLEFIYGTKWTLDLGGFPISLIYGVGFGTDQFYLFGGYNFSLDLSALGDLGGLLNLGDFSF